ncbi:Trafficking protein particle complex 8 [Mactra antiquata]
MAQHKQTAHEFIQSTFSPQVAVLCSNDAELLCQKNNLSFVQLVQPFSRLKTEAHIKDPNNVQHSVQHLRIGVVDMNNQIPPAAAAKKLMNDAVNNEQPQLSEGNRGNVITVGDYDLQLSSSTPWFEAYREVFLQTLPQSDHEFLKHCLASMLQTLSSSQQQQQSQFPNKLPLWFSPNILKYYVLLHDVVEAEASKAEAVYQSMKSSFGHQSCHLLQINSRSLTAVETMKLDTSLPDPWGQFLPKKIDIQEGVDYDTGGSSGGDDSIFPTQLDEGTNGNNIHIGDTNSNSDEGVDGLGTINNVVDHPLAMSNESPLQSPNMDYSSDYQGSSSSLNSIQSALSKSSSFGVTDKNKFPGHGMCLTASDQDRIRIFMHEFAVRALIPWAERQMRTLNDLLMSRTGIRKSLFGTARKLFGGNPSKSNQASSNATTVVYSKDAPELQMRRLADLAFLFQLYDFAYQTYHSAKRDFNNDNAWLHFAGTLEMASLAIFMLGNQSQRSYPDHYMESAITTYLQSCRNVPYSVRATLVSTEALKSRGKYKDAAMQFIKMMSEDSDLRSALLLEQAAHCFINMRNAMVRKYSFHMILAGHRFSKAGQRKHALRAYSQALQIYKGKGWSLAEDHINFTIGRQSHNLKQLENATAAFKHLLTEDSKQTPMQQNAFLREYLFVYRQLLVQEAEETGLQSNILPELPLPILDSNATKVLLGARPQPPQNEKMFATGVWFEQSESHTNKWKILEDLLVSSANGGSLPLIYKPTLQLYTDDTDNKYNPVGYVREPITIEFYLVNPLKVALTMTDVMLLWSFLPTISSMDKPQLITNEHMVTAKNNLSDEIVHGQTVKEIILQGNDRLAVQMTLAPQQMGELRIYGITYNLGSSATTFMAPSQGPSGPLGSTIAGPKASYVSTVYVRGKQKIEVQGPRLNNKKEEMAVKTYGPDRRLDLTIQEEMPLLQVSFLNFPRTLLCGEVHPVTLSFTNVGSSPMHKLMVASSNPKCFVLGTVLNKHNLGGVYKSSSVKDELNCVKCDTDNVGRVTLIDLPGGVLHPKGSFSIQLWIRGNDIGGNHEIDFLFYYESAQKSTKPRYRLLRHNVLVNTVESLSVRAVAQKACRHSTSNDTSNIGQMLISCEMENLSQQQSGRAHVQQIEVKQISCASKNWTIHSLTSTIKADVHIGSRELLQICLKAVNLSSNDNTTDGTTFTDLSFHGDKIVSSESPCRQFYERSNIKLKALDEETFQSSTPSQNIQSVENMDEFQSLNCAIELGISLIILWQAHIVDINGSERLCVGQHHVLVEKTDCIFTSYPYMLVPKESPPIKFIKEEVTNEEKKPAFEVLTQLVSYTLQYQTEVDNCFSKCRLCFVHVTVVLENLSEAEVSVLVDTSKAQLRLNDYLDAGVAVESPAGGFSWVGQTLKQLKLSPKETQNILLSVSFGKPGVYNINNLAVFVTYQHDSTEMTQQKQTKPCVITVRDAPS